MVKMADLPGRKILLDDSVKPVRTKLCQNQDLYELAHKMEIGDSLMIDKPLKGTSTASNLGRSTGFKFRQRSEGNKLRVWRVE